MHIVIIGNGISGITTARWIRKLSDSKVTVISSESKYLYSRPALMYIYMGHMKFEHTKPYEDGFWEKNRIDLLFDHVESVNLSSQNLQLKSGQSLTYDKLVLAVGSKSNKFGWPGQELDGVCGLYSLQDLNKMEEFSPGLKRAVIVGGGLIGIEMAEMFHSRNIPVSIVAREKEYWINVLPLEEAAMISRHIREHHIDLQLATELKEIIDDGSGKVAGIITNKGDRIDCGFVGLTPGVSPNIGFLENTPLEIQKGIVVNEYLETNIKGVYAVGDCAQLKNPPVGRRPIEAVWYVGRMMGETLAHTLCGNPTEYNPGIWFNSAKFLDIEYQVYGTVLSIPPESHTSFYWEHQDELKSLRIVYEKSSKKVLGINLMGLRFRHEVCEQWIDKGKTISEVMPGLALANFDPEFYKQHEEEIIQKFNRDTGNNIKPSKKRNLNQALSFLKTGH